MGALKSWLFNVYVACNMLLCAVFAFGKSRPRETISGCLGRVYEDAVELGKDRPVVKCFARLVDWIYFWEPDHCRVTAAQEAASRKPLGYEE
jgi:hypothetical protein